MKKCTIFWKGQSKSGNYYLGVTFEEQGFMMKKFIQLTESKFEELADSGEINIPTAALQ